MPYIHIYVYIYIYMKSVGTSVNASKQGMKCEGKKHTQIRLALYSVFTSEVKYMYIC